FLGEWKPDGNEGKVQALEDAVARLQKGHQVALEGGGADVVDYTTREAVQHKRIFRRDRQLKDVLGDAAEQLRGTGGEIPPEHLPARGSMPDRLGGGWLRLPARLADSQAERIVDEPVEDVGDLENAVVTASGGDPGGIRSTLAIVLNGGALNEPDQPLSPGRP